MAVRSDLFPMIEEVARLIADARARGDRAADNTLQVRMADLVALNAAWAKAEASGASVAPYIRDLQVQARQVSMAKLAADKAAQAKAQQAFNATAAAKAQQDQVLYQRESAPGFLDKLLATVQQGGMVVTLAALAALFLMLPRGGRR